MQRYLYMRPALQPSEAVLLPALSRRRWQEPLVMEPAHLSGNDNFVPVTGDWNGHPVQTKELSTQVRSCGSMAGRGILRAVGAMENPYARRSRMGRRHSAFSTIMQQWNS